MTLIDHQLDRKLKQETLDLTAYAVALPVSLIFWLLIFKLTGIL